MRCLAGFLVLALSGCSGYLAPDIDRFEASLSEDYPVGSPSILLERKLERRGFRPGQPFNPDSSKRDPAARCLRRGLAYGFWGGGGRFVCYRTEGGRITKIEAFDLVAGL